jgi:hypothetical protein
MKAPYAHPEAIMQPRRSEKSVPLSSEAKLMGDMANLRLR